MGQTQELQSNKKVWTTVLTCLIGAAILIAISRGFPDKATNLFFVLLGAGICVIGLRIWIPELLGYPKQLGFIPDSIRNTLERAEEIATRHELDNEDEAIIQDALYDIDNYQEVNDEELPKIVIYRAQKLRERLRKK